MIAGSLSLVDANFIESLREAMIACISQKLRIRPGLPPDGDVKAHREQNYATFLGEVPNVQLRALAKGNGLVKD